MWIVQLQARHFYKKETDVREDFTRMLKDRKANIPNICHAALYEVKSPKGKVEQQKRRKKRMKNHRKVQSGEEAWTTAMHILCLLRR